MLSDKYFDANPENKRFTEDFTKWIFHERGVLRYSNVTIVDSLGFVRFKNTFAIKDFLNYSIVIEEWSETIWKPFECHSIQLEFSMLDPYVRTDLIFRDGKYETSFQIHDVYGIFSCNLRYLELGYTSLEVKTMTPVRPYRHDEYPRFLQVAFPYYSGCLSIVGGTILFSVFFFV